MPTATTVDGVEIAHSVVGEGPALLLVHGITECRAVWDPLVPALAETHTVVTLDLRGHGESGRAADHDARLMVEDLAAVAGSLGVAQPLLVGHSLGGSVVTAYAGQHPCRGVVNIDQSIALGDFADLLRAAEPLLRSEQFADVVTELLTSMQGPLPAAEAARVAALRRPDQEVVLDVWAPLLVLDPAALQAMVDEITAAVTVPYLALHGIDPGPTYGPWLTSAIPTATLEVWDDHGHYPHLVDPDRFVARLRAFDESLG